MFLAVCGIADGPSTTDDQKTAKAVAMCLLPWLQKLCVVPVLRTLTGDLLLQNTEGELRILRHQIPVCKVSTLDLCLPVPTTCYQVDVMTYLPWQTSICCKGCLKSQKMHPCTCTPFSQFCIVVTLVVVIAVCLLVPGVCTCWHTA